MTSPTHIVLSVAATLAIASTADLKPHGAEWLALLLGSLAPDIDTERSAIAHPGSLIKPFVPKFIRVLLDALGGLVSRLISMAFGHRNAMHWPLIGIVFICMGINGEEPWLSWFGWGYVCHIFGDFCTKSGAPLFGPFLRRDLKWSPLRTGSGAERLVFILLTGIICWQGQGYLPVNTQDWLAVYRRIIWP